MLRTSSSTGVQPGTVGDNEIGGGGGSKTIEISAKSQKASKKKKRLSPKNIEFSSKPNLASQKPTIAAYFSNETHYEIYDDELLAIIEAFKT